MGSVGLRDSHRARTGFNVFHGGSGSIAGWAVCHGGFTSRQGQAAGWANADLDCLPLLFPRWSKPATSATTPVAPAPLLTPSSPKRRPLWRSVPSERAGHGRGPAAQHPALRPPGDAGAPAVCGAAGVGKCIHFPAHAHHPPRLPDLKPTLSGSMPGAQSPRIALPPHSTQLAMHPHAAHPLPRRSCLLRCPRVTLGTSLTASRRPRPQRSGAWACARSMHGHERAPAGCACCPTAPALCSCIDQAAMPLPRALIHTPPFHLTPSSTPLRMLHP